MGMAAESKFHVLAVDDSFFDRKLIERLLQKSSCQVTTVDSGYKALEFLGFRECNEGPNVLPTSPNNHKGVEVDLIITDYCMPGMTGYDLLKKLKESSAFKHIPVVIMSSENVPARITSCLEEGAEEFLLKPVRLADINKLKPYMMKKQKLEEIEKPSEIENGVVTTAAVGLKQEIIKDSTKTGTEVLPEEQILSSSTNNKRKPIEEGISKDRSRPRFDGITTAV